MADRIDLAPALDASWQRPIAVVSVGVCLAVAFLILGPRPGGVAGAIDVSRLPPVQALLNTVTTALLVAGYAAVKTRRLVLHKRLMLSAFATSTAFLAVYVVYHWFSPGPAHYTGPLRALYLIVLVSHIVLAAGILPLALTTLVRALVGAYDRHRRIAPVTLGIWLYVSVTGVLIYAAAHR